MNGTANQPILPIPNAPDSPAQMMQRAIPGAHPDPAGLVGRDAGGDIPDPAGFRTDRIPFSILIFYQNSTLADGPNNAVQILAHRCHRFKGESIFLPHQSDCGGSDQIQPAAPGANPDIAFLIRSQTTYRLMRQGNFF